MYFLKHISPLLLTFFLLVQSMARGHAETCGSADNKCLSVTPVLSESSNTEAPLQNKNSVRTNQDASPHYLRTALEMGILIGTGTAWYWIDRERQVADWDFPSWTDKLFIKKEVRIFDSNPFMVNYTWHPSSGGALHLLARSNGLGLYSSFAAGSLASIFWELNIESREKLSINDLVITNMTGLPIGEFFHRIGQYVNQGQKGVGWDIARWTVALPHTAHARLDNRPVQQEQPLSASFRWYYALDAVDFTREDGTTSKSDRKILHTLGFTGKMVALDGHKSPGQHSTFFAQANFVDFSLQFSQGQGTGTRSEANALVAGWHYQDIPTSGQDSLEVGFRVATNIGYFYHREQFEDWQDRLGGLHLPGIALEGELAGKNWALRGHMYGNADFVGVNSMAWQQYRQEYPYTQKVAESGDNLGKAVLRDSGYYYGLGLSTRMEAELEIDRFTLGGNLFLAKYDSIEGYERDTSIVPAEKEVQGRDYLNDFNLWFRTRLYDQGYAQLKLGRYFREGTLDRFKANENMTRVNLELGVQF